MIKRLGGEMSDNPQIVSSVVVDETGTVIVHDSRPDNLEEDEFWSCTYRAVIKAACVVQGRDSVISDTGVFVSPDSDGRQIEGWGAEDVERAQRFVAAKFPDWRIIETDSNGETTVKAVKECLRRNPDQQRK